MSGQHQRAPGPPGREPRRPDGDSGPGAPPSPWQFHHPDYRGYIFNTPELSTVEILCDTTKYYKQVRLGLFKSNEVTVDTNLEDRTLTIECKQTSESSAGGSDTNHAIRKFYIPDNVDMASVEHCISSDGVLTIFGTLTKERPVLPTERKHKSRRRKEEPRCIEKETAMMETAYRNIASRPGCSTWADELVASDVPYCLYQLAGGAARRRELRALNPYDGSDLYDLDSD